MIIGGLGSRKTNSLLNLINLQDHIDTICLYAKDLSEPKYEFLIKKREKPGIEHLDDLNAFTECSNTVDDVYEDIDEYNPSRKRKTLIVFKEMIADVIPNKKFQAVLKNLFIRCRKLNISLVFIIQSYFSISKEVRSNSTHYLIIKLTTKQNYKTSQLITLQILIIKIYRQYAT